MCHLNFQFFLFRVSTFSLQLLFWGTNKWCAISVQFVPIQKLTFQTENKKFMKIICFFFSLPRFYACTWCLLLNIWKDQIKFIFFLGNTICFHSFIKFNKNSLSNKIKYRFLFCSFFSIQLFFLFASCTCFYFVSLFCIKMKRNFFISFSMPSLSACAVFLTNIS